MMKILLRQGFTILELLITLAIVGVLLGVALPSFNNMSSNNQVGANSNALHMSLMLSRSEALSRMVRITMCSSSNGTSCAGGGWEQGWIIFVDTDNDAVADGGETILRVNSALTGNGVTARGDTQVANYISFINTGFTMTTSGAVQAGSLAVCDSRGFTSDARVVTISATGRTKVVVATTSALSSCTP